MAGLKSFVMLKKLVLRKNITKLMKKFEMAGSERGINIQLPEGKII